MGYEPGMSGDGDQTAVRVRISGRVQGVWYRGWTVDEARRRGLRGWVRNRTDGTVEAVFAGPEEAVAEMLAACWQGPRSAQVADVAQDAVEPPPGDGFRLLPTA